MKPARPRPVQARFRLAYLVSHPIQYQAPFLRYLAAQGTIDLEVFFLSDFSAGAYRDPGFATDVRWDVPLCEGYRHTFLTRGRRPGRLRPVLPGLTRRLVEQGFDALWVHGWSQSALLGAALGAARAGLPVFLRGESVPESRGGLRRRALAALFGRASACLAIGARNAAYYREHGVSPERIFRVPYAVDGAYFAERARAARPQRAQLQRELELDPDRPVVLYASKLLERKRPLDLLAAWERLVSAGRGAAPQLVFAGDGPEGAELAARAAEHGGRGVRLLGFRNQSELPALFDLCDVFSLPSRFETWGLCLNEVMATGRPVVTTPAVGASEDLVIPGETGLLHEPRDVNGLAAALAELVWDRRAARAMGKRAAQHVAAFDFEAGHAGLMAALERTRGARAA